MLQHLLPLLLLSLCHRVLMHHSTSTAVAAKKGACKNLCSPLCKLLRSHKGVGWHCAKAQIALLTIRCFPTTQCD
jgi:hypothetical protein